MYKVADEEFPLLPSQPVKRTPFPWFQFVVVSCLRLIEPLHSHVIYPFLPQLIRDIGVTDGNEAKVGYYVGLMQSVFFIFQALAAFPLSTTSDRVGRRPVILISFLGMTISMFFSGLSKTLWGLVLSRGINGALNATLGVIKSVTIEITDQTNIAQACAYLPISFYIATGLAPILGGSLSHPAERFPRVFGSSQLLKEYPFLLPCASAAAISALSMFIAFMYLQETVRNPVPLSRLFKFWGQARYSPSVSINSGLEGPGTLPHLTPEAERPLPLRALLTPRVILVAANYAVLSLVSTSFYAVQPLFYSTPVHLGGLGLPPSTIGKILSASGIVGGAMQVLFYARIHDYWGSKNVFLFGAVFTIPALASFPVLSYLAKGQEELSTTVWVVVALQAISWIGPSFSYATVLIFIAAASPNRASVGATNGISQVSVSVLKAVAPAISNSLFSLSMEKGYLGGYLVYYILLVMSVVLVTLASLLPRNLWIE